MNTEATHLKSAFKAAQYVRMSTEHQQYSTQNQADKIQEYADKRGIEIIKTYADEGKSGLSARIGLRIHLPNPIENILRAQFDNALVHGADYTLSGHSDLEFEFVVDGVLVSFLRIEFNNFTVDSMTDTMLRHAYLDIVNDLEQVVPW